ncbi:MAG: phenylacetate--CoA ligase family protein [Chloroflexi bacterium]|nr:phenylacetate--CoA ligase family protein [Ardenticatenaceae bacterium]MBL1129169.1 phenylacetate--CoA ligase family protein [Chloroflexota bacterium]NOG35245.1 phenylacetate--CoA ligase family protein [Chloroflexota bacterium]GIK58468.1 MAG: coenzyme F390 synthetase [Chloroflexota bacterium]
MNGLDQRLRAFVEFAYENATAVKNRFDQAGIHPAAIQGVADLVKIPVFPKDGFIQLQQADPPFGGMVTIPREQVTHIFFSPGPIYEPAPEPDEANREIAMAALRLSGFRSGEMVLNSFSYHLVPAGFLFDGALTRLGCTVVPGGIGNSDLQIKMAHDLQATGYAGTPSFLLSLLEKAKEQGIKLAIDHAIVSAEPLLPPMRAAIEAFGVKIGNAYATAEFGIIALNTGNGMAFQLFAEPLVEVLDPETGHSVGPGEAGEIVVTNFSRVYPLIRIGTGDMAINMDPDPGHSQQTERGIILVGRSGDAVKVRGMFVHPNQLGFAARQIPGVLKVQGVVTQPDNKDHFVVRAEIAEGVASTAVTTPLQEMIKNVCRVRVDAVECLPPGSLGDNAPGMVDDRDWGR